MKTLEVRYLQLSDDSLETISKSLDELPVNHIDVVNWQEYPFKPNVSFKIGYSKEALYIKYIVREPAVRAVNAAPNSDVWEDSCCEFFCDFDGKGYYNLETNCIGTQLLGWGESMKDRALAAKSRTRADVSVISKIRKVSTLGLEPFDVKIGDFSYEIVMAIPVDSFYKHKLNFEKGMTFRANFYKCGDKTPDMHFLSWNPIGVDSPNFHLPEFFGEIKLV